MTELKKRVITGLCLAPVIASVFYFFPPSIFLIFLILVSALATYEAARLAMIEHSILIILIIFFTVLSSVPLYFRSFEGYFIWIFFSISLYFVFETFIFKIPDENTYIELSKGIVALILSEIFILAPLVYFYYLKLYNNYLPLIALLSIWGSDTLAYFIGKRFGKRPFIPQISPKKTIEGLFGAILGSVIIITCAFKITGLGIIESLFTGIIMGILGQIGDVFESMWKRLCKIKDSSALLPGHGGILDRIDSFIFSVPFLYHYLLVRNL